MSSLRDHRVNHFAQLVFALPALDAARACPNNRAIESEVTSKDRQAPLTHAGLALHPAESRGVDRRLELGEGEGGGVHVIAACAVVLVRLQGGG